MPERRLGTTELRFGAALLALAVGAWALTADRMAGMDAGPGTDLGALGPFVVSWLVMMTAMMLPAVARTVIAYDRRAVRRAATGAFAAGYLLVWLAAGLVGYAAIELVRWLEPGILAWNEAGRYVAAGVVAGAGLLQLTPSQHACLHRCRERLTFLREHWRPGRLGGLRMGLEHGRDCVGCSWSLMAALFALGAMSLTWMALVTVLITAERLLPRPARLGVALALVALGTCVALVPADVPALTLPGSESMGGMRMD